MYSDMSGAILLDGAARKKAIRLNPKYAYSVPWHRSFAKIATLLGFSHMSPDAGAFADGVANWQAARGALKIDGILGPNTWTQMEPECVFSGGASMLLDPDWLKETPHKARAEPAQGGRENTGGWVGLSVEVCWMAGAAGRGMTLQRLWSVDGPGRTFTASTDRVKIGVGAGYGVSASAVLVTNVYEPGVLIGRQFGTWDLNVSLGTKITALLKNAINMEKTADLLSAVKKLRDLEKAQQKAQGTKLLKEFVKIDGGAVESLARFFKERRETIEAIEKDDGPTVCMIGLPLPGMVEVSAAYVDDKYDFVDYR